MLATTGSVALVGVDARLVDVEVDAAQGVPKFTVVGLPNKSIREAEQRTRSALLSCSERWPGKRVVANLAPAGLKKDGTHFDLPLALALIAADGRMKPEVLKDWVVMGELGLDGSVRRVRGVLAAALACRAAGKTGIVCPAANSAEAAVVDGIKIVPVISLTQAAAFFRGKSKPSDPLVPAYGRDPSDEDLLDVRGQNSAKIALEVAAAGGHNLLLEGPPGSGKTMLARRFPGILPKMSIEECLEVTRIHSIAGLLPEGTSLITSRPFRLPHHNASQSALIGGGSGICIPGEASLAHYGVLFLDELTLYRRDALESLRGPVEDGFVWIARTGDLVRFPCRFSLLAAMNPCPCGYAGEGSRCRCTSAQIDRYLSRLSGPLLDRFDLRVETIRLKKTELAGPSSGDPTESVRERVERARLVQTERYGSPLKTNATVPGRELHSRASLTKSALDTLSEMAETLRFSGRAWTRMVRVSRTIADLASDDVVDAEHVARALAYRFSVSAKEVAA